MKALASLRDKLSLSQKSGNGSGPLPAWKYICKVWPQDRTIQQNALDLDLAKSLGIADQVIYSTGRDTRAFMPYLLAACDIYAAPSRLEGFGMPQVEAGACEKPVIGIAAMGMLDTLVHGETALLAGVAEANYIKETTLGSESGYPEGQRIAFATPRIADYRASVEDICQYIEALMRDPDLRQRLGKAGRKRAIESFNYRLVAGRFVEIVSQQLGIG